MPSNATRVARQFVQYHERVLATNPIAYWPLNEKQGNVAYDWVSGRVAGAQNGAHTGVTLAQPGIGDGNTCPLYDGANDYTDTYSAAFDSAFNGQVGTVALWCRMSGAGVWIDSTIRYAVEFYTDGNNFVQLRRTVNNNQMNWRYKAGGTEKNVNNATFAGTTAWFHMAITWDLAAGVNGEMKAYKGGVQTGATQTALGTWAGALDANVTLLGAQSKAPAGVWNGYLAHCAVWNRVLAPGEIAALATL